MDVCPVCGENAVKEDTENCQKIRVCIECGALDSDMQELTSEDQFQGTTITDGKGYGPAGRRNWMNDGSGKIQKNKTLGTKLITSIGNQLNVGEQVTTDACQLYEKVYETDLHYAAQDIKKAMCLACLYASARRQHIPINIRMLGFFLNIKDSARRFAAALKKLKVKHDVHLPTLNVQNETWGVLSQSGLSNEVIKMTQQLMLIMQHALITTGRSYPSVVVPCSYFAFKASDILKYKKLSFKVFCRKFSFKLSPNYKPEVENTLKAMAKELPWVKGAGVEPNRVEVHIKDIIKYQSLLIAQAIQTVASQMDEVNEDTKVIPETRNEPGFIFRKFPKRKVEEGNEKDGGPSESKKVKHKKREERASDGAGNSSGLESFDLGSDDDTDIYILPMHEVLLKKEILKAEYGLDVDEEKIDNSKNKIVNKAQPSQTKCKNRKPELAHDTPHDGDDTDNEADNDDKIDENDGMKFLLRRQCDGTANDSTLSDDDFDYI